MKKSGPTKAIAGLRTALRPTHADGLQPVTHAHGSARPTFAGLFALALLAASGPVWAHAETGVAGGLISGFLHPVYGPDHLVAMVAVGLWGAQLGAPAIWVLPVAFPMVMTLGALAGVAGIPIPFVELGVSSSALVLGLAVAARFTPPLPLAAVLVALFGMFHGYAHGAELPGAVNPLAYGIGFVVSTGCLHLAGIIIGLLEHVPHGPKVVRGCGALVALTGLYFIGMNLGLS